jgi:hypothetical protein
MLEKAFVVTVFVPGEGFLERNTGAKSNSGRPKFLRLLTIFCSYAELDLTVAGEKKRV